ncbi:MAG: hypothetical protein ACPGAO_05735 [Flavobacteriaceae bacterium]
MRAKFRIYIEVISAISIVLSLVFLGLEVNTYNKLSKASIRQSLNETDMEVGKMHLDQEVIVQARYKLARNQELTDFEEYMMIEYQSFNYRDFDNSFYQYRMGLFDENAWLAYRRVIKDDLQNNKYVKEMWKNYKQRFSLEFQNEIEGLRKIATNN